MDSAKVQLADKLKSANNILVTVSRNPSIDQLSACVGLALLLNKQGKHAAAVFSGEVPSTLEFLKPEETLQKNTDSLRDFIIALDKHKADKLRYKVEDDVVRIFITPYKTTISQDDLEFSQGDFNVDVVIALGVFQQEDLDEAITAHGRILHDATVASINTSADGSLGSLNWHDPEASSLSELVTELGQMLGKDVFDNQIATALLTGIVAETERFSNSRTTSETMRASAVLMAAGADQQLVASKLEEPAEPELLQEQSDIQNDDSFDAGGPEVPAEKPPKKPSDGTLEISHDVSDEVSGNANETSGNDQSDTEPRQALELPKPVTEQEPEHAEPAAAAADKPAGLSNGSRIITDKPQLGSMLTANTMPEQLDPSVDPLSMLNPDVTPILSRSQPPVEHKAATIEPPVLEKPEPQPVPSAPVVNEAPALPPLPTPPTAQPAENTMPALTPPPTDWVAPPPVPPAPEPAPAPSVPAAPAASPETHGETLADLESNLRAHADSAREEVNKVLSSSPGPLPPKQDLNAQFLGEPLHQPVIDGDPTAVPAGQPLNSHQDELSALNLHSDAPPPAPEPPKTEAPAEAAKGDVSDPTAPPPVPPPFDPTKFSSDPTPPAEQPKA